MKKKKRDDEGFDDSSKQLELLDPESTLELTTLLTKADVGPLTTPEIDRVTKLVKKLWGKLKPS